MQGSREKIKYKGGCHCKGVRYEAEADTVLSVFKCNCSICIMKQNHSFIIPKENFTITQGEDLLTTYTFNTKIAQHKFCKICGIQSFYFPRSHPNKVAVTLYCLDDYPKVEYNVIEFDGQNWEQEMEKNGEIKNF